MSETPEFVGRSEATRPPAAPDPPPGPRLYPYQWVGMLVLGLIVLLALARVFGPASDESRAESSALAVEVRYPTRFRYKQIDRVSVRVRNLSPATLDTVTVAVDPAYLRNFSNVAATPAFERVYTVPISGLAPGQEAELHIGIQAERFGLHEGWMRISAGRDTVRFFLSTFAFP